MKKSRKTRKREKRGKEHLSYLKGKSLWLFYEAREAMERGKENLAIEMLNRAVKIDPEFFHGHLFLGSAYQEIGDYNLALRSLLKAKQIDPFSTVVYYYLGNVYFNLNMLEQALQSYNYLLSLLKGKKLTQIDREIKKEVKEKILILKSPLKEKENSFSITQNFSEEATVKDKQIQDLSKFQTLSQTSLQEIFTGLKIPKKFKFEENNSLLEALEREKYEPFASYRLRVQANELFLLKGFDRLLCLKEVKGVKKFWYQIETAKKALKYFRGRVLLCDEVGLGKTIEAGMILKEYLIRGLVRKVLILVPPSLVIQWEDEMASKFNIKFITTDSPSYLEKGELFWKKNDLIIASINIAKSKKNSRIITEIDYDMVIVDEAHHLKNRNTLNWKFVNSLKKKFILLLTATPVHNDLMELYNLITLLKPGQLKTPSSFRKVFVVRGDPRIPKNREKLRELLSEVMIRNTRSIANINLPKRYATTIKVPMEEEEKRFYEKLSSFVREAYLSNTINKFTSTLLQMEAGSSPFATRSTLLNLIKREKLSLNALEKVKQLLDLSNLSSFAKAEKLVEMVSKNKEKIIVFTNYLETQIFLAKKLTQRGVECSLINGTLSSIEKERNIGLFQDKAKVLLSTQIGGEGKNLTFCNTMINYDLSWNPMRIEQRIGRIHRIGQKRDVFVFNFSAPGTVEDYIIDILDKKINMFELVLGEMDMILGNLDESRDFSDIIMDIWISEDREKGFKELGDKLLQAKKRYLEVKKYEQEMLQHDYEL